jgi:Transposase IS66 family
VFAAPTLELPIDRGLAGPSMLADTIVRRWQDHQPLTRLDDIYRREQLDLAKSTLCTWHEQLADLARPLIEAMFEDAYREPCLCVDATGVLVLAKEKRRSGEFWALIAQKKHVLYDYSRKHYGLAVDNLLKGYKGYLVADAHSVYEHVSPSCICTHSSQTDWQQNCAAWFKTVGSPTAPSSTGGSGGLGTGGAGSAGASNVAGIGGISNGN